jgi:hypothetical protein
MDIAVSPPHKMSGGGKKVAAHDWVIMTVLIVNQILAAYFDNKTS